jgi:hypothetical protein
MFQRLKIEGPTAPDLAGAVQKSREDLGGVITVFVRPHGVEIGFAIASPEYAMPLEQLVRALEGALKNRGKTTVAVINGEKIEDPSDLSLADVFKIAKTSDKPGSN